MANDDTRGIGERIIEALDAAGYRRRSAASKVSVMGGGSGDEAVAAGRDLLGLLARTGGYSVPSWPVELGGAGLSGNGAALREVAAATAQFELPDLYPFGVGTALVGPTVIEHGTDEQRTTWLPKIADGSEIWCQLFSEPDAGSDLANLACRAERDGDVWRITGQKVWSSRAHYSDWGLLLARTDPAQPKHAGITAFGVPMKQDGVVVRPLIQLNGDDHFNEVFLDGAIVDDRWRIGGIGQGWSIALTTLAHERSGLGGSGMGGGISKAQVLDLARRTDRSTDPLARQRLARAYTGMEIGRLSRVVGAGTHGSAAKLRMVASTKSVADLAADLLGPAAVAASSGDGFDEWRTLFLTAPSMSIRGGTDEVQRNIVGERVLGLPPEPRVDKGIPFRDVRR
ncbi:MAG TPA: acyl-CoA dehydrogenase family protein [Acidimicrobiales bacterium]|nr:acyl-CoA dehydrogenase family protein [Acidimicrobiales bacterium]